MPESRKLIALTFDDGPNTTVTPLVLDILERYRAAGTFFLIGENIADDTAAVMRRALDMGCELENHSFSHPYMDRLSPDEIRSEIGRTEERISSVTGRGSVFFRPPYFAVSDEMYDNIDLCFITGRGCNDWDDSVTVEKRIDGVLSAACDGAVILMHDQPDNFKTVEALEKTVPALAGDGYSFVTVAELFKARGLDPHDKTLCRRRVFERVERSR